MGREAFESIAQGLREAIAYQRGERAEGTKIHEVAAEDVDDVDVKALRESLDLTQEGFAAAFCIKVATVRQWEARRRRPTGPARVLLRALARDPVAVLHAIRG